MVNKELILKELKKHKNFDSDAKFAQYLGISTQNLSAWYKRNTFDENKIVDKFPEVNKVWILTGEGEMLKNSNTNQVNGNGNTSVAGNGNQITNANITEMLELQKGYQEMIKTGQMQLSESQSQINRLITIIEHLNKIKGNE